MYDVVVKEHGDHDDVHDEVGDFDHIPHDLHFVLAAPVLPPLLPHFIDLRQYVEQQNEGKRPGQPGPYQMSWFRPIEQFDGHTIKTYERLHTPRGGVLEHDTNSHHLPVNRREKEEGKK